MSQQKAGFALIVAISLMAFIILILLSLSTLTSLELASTSTDRDRARAEENALLGLEVALGNLQRLLGKDQRVSASPMMLDKNLSEGDPRGNWTGVWDSAEFLSDGVTPNPTYGQNLGWLISGFDDADSAGAVPAFSAPFNGDGTLSSQGNAKLLGGATVDYDEDANIDDYIAAPKVEIDDASHYAYWISDEGRKAQINLTSREDRGEEYGGITDNVKSRLSLSSPGRYNASVLNGLEDFQLEADRDLSQMVYRSGSSRDLVLGEPGDPINSNWQSPLASFYHDINYGSIALQTDTRNGGLKRDLSLLFEMSDSDFAKTPYSGEATEAAFDTWVNLPENDDKLAKPYVDPMTGDGVSYLFKEPVEVPRYAGKDAFVRGPTWHYLRDFYRLYKDVDDNGSKPKITTRPFAPTARDFGNEGGLRGLIPTFETDRGGDISALDPKSDNYVNTFVTNGNGIDEHVTRLTGHEVLPVVNRVIYVYSLYEDRNVDEYEYFEGIENGKTVKKFRATGNTTDAIALVIDPYVYLWNPYNVAIEFDGGIKIHSEQSAFGLMISVAPEDADIIPPIADPSRAQMTGYISAFGKINVDPGSFQDLDLVIGAQSSGTIVMEPGEVKLFSSANSTPVELASLPIVNDERSGTDSFVAPAMLLSEGFNRHGGLLLGRRHNSRESFDEGVLHQLKADDSQTYQVNVYNWGLSGWVGKDRRDRPSRSHNTQIAYVPQDALFSGGTFAGGSLVDSDTLLQRLYLNIFGPKVGNERGPLVDLLYERDVYPLSVVPSRNIAAENRSTDPPGKWPFLYFGLYQNTVDPDFNVVEAATEFVGTMSPYSPLVDAQFSNSGIGNPPYSVQIGFDEDFNEIQRANGKGFFGAKYGFGGVSHLVVSEIPTYPARSIASLQHARIAPSAYMPGQAIGNSWASGFVDLDKTYTDDNGRYTLYDISYLSNEALFDSYFFSSLTPAMDLAGDVQETADLESTLTTLAANALSQGEIPELSNERFAFIGDYSRLGPDSASPFVDDLSSVDGFGKTAAYFGVRGGFNINSLSVDAWDAFLASTLVSEYSYYNPEGSLGQVTDSGFTILPRTTLPNADSSNEWLGPKGLSNTERLALAQEIVNQVRTRGPFLSLTDFVNRDLSTGAEGRVGAIQAAIDAIDVNDAQEYVDAYTEGTGGAFKASNITAKTGVGTPQYLTQADVLTPLAPYISARSDTFVIRSYGDVEDSLTGRIKSKAWCEAVVQRLPGFVDESESPDTQLPNLTQTDNQNLGRQFRVISFRWLNENEV